MSDFNREERYKDVYTAVSESIMQTRIDLCNPKHRLDRKQQEHVDFELFRLEIKIWEEIAKVLDMTGM